LGRGPRLVALVAALLVLSAAPAAAARLQGIDVSRFDDRIDWRRVAGDGIEFAFVQASRGAGDDCAVKPRRCGRDGLYERNYEAARAAGVRVGAYHRAFADGSDRASAKADAKAEALVFTREVGRLRDGDLLPALDAETPFDGLGPRLLRVWIRTWLKRVEARLGARPIVYTNVSSWAATGDTTEVALAGHPLWVANWGVAAPAVPAANWAGRGWSVWQYTNSGSVAGIHGRVDRDVLRGGFDPLTVARRR
jgi:GH25 family lysozyme M1 (1,4-beta-N-acetylmuramidase)